MGKIPNTYGTAPSRVYDSDELFYFAPKDFSIIIYFLVIVVKELERQAAII